MNSVRAPSAGERIHSFTKISFSGWLFFFPRKRLLVSRAGLGAAAEWDVPGEVAQVVPDSSSRCHCPPRGNRA